MSDDLASVCSSLSSDEDCEHGVHNSSEHLVDLLTRPRARGGYGGRLTYTDFSTLATSLGWSSEDMDDCWYDILMGEPTAEARDMRRAADCICSYCLAAPLPLLETYAAGSTSDAASPSEAEATVPSPLQPPTPPTPAAAQSTSCVILSPPSPPRSAKRPAKVSRPPPGTLPRYAVETASSERRRLSSGAAQTPQRPRRSAESPARAADAPTVFFRLYENGMELHRKRNTATPPADAAAVAECTFQPKIAPYPLKDSEGAERQTRFNKPTRSSFAKLMADDACRSAHAIAHTPETPRVSYHPAPGPSTSVPAGYVEGVARLRRYVASRYERADAQRDLRETPRTDVHRLVEAPILRLPVTVEGVSDAVDVRLAPAQQHASPSSQRRRSVCGNTDEAFRAASTPRRSPSTLVRYKEHTQFY